MKLAILGSRGPLGSAAAAEAKVRGHQAVFFVPAGEACCADAVEKDLQHLTAEDFSGFDAAVLAEPGLGGRMLAASLLPLFAALPNTRLILCDTGKCDCTCGDTAALTVFRTAEMPDTKGFRTGKPVVSEDPALVNTIGAARISIQDWAIALLDELEKKAFAGKTFTAVSDDPYFRGAPQFFRVDKYMFSRAGAWIALSVDSLDYGTGALYLTTNRGMRTHSTLPDKTKLFRIYPTHNGKRVPFAVQSAPAELTLHTLYGDIRFTWADHTKLMAEGDPGTGLLWTRKSEAYELLKPRKDGAWESAQRAAGPLLFKGLEGSSFVFDDTWNWYDLNCGTVCGHTVPREDGRFSMVCEESSYAAKVRDSYPTYAEAKADMQADWEAFLAKMPHFLPFYERKREDTAYVLWTHLVAPTATTPNWMMLMFPGEMDSAWQLVQNGVALQDNTALSRDLLLAPLKRQGEDGQLADGYDEAFLSTGSYKPNVYGWALKNVMAHHDLAAEWSREDLETLYAGAGKWSDWFLAYRDDDGDGLPGFEGGNENGFDEVTAYFDTLSLATPDLCAQEVLNFEAVGDLAKLLGKPDAEVQSWYSKSKTLLDKMIEKMWDGEHFVALKQYTHEPVFSGANMHYIPFVLGKRLPQHIIDKMAADLAVEGKLLSPYGIASECLDSDVFEFTGVKMGCGPISPPAELFILSGMWEAGCREQAKNIIDRYLGRLMDGGFSHFINPISGEGTYFWGTWCRAVFTILARMVSEG